MIYTHKRSFRKINWRRVRCTGPVVHAGETRNAFRISVVKPGGKGLLVKSGLRWKGNTEADLKEIGHVNWIHLALFSF